MTQSLQEKIWEDNLIRKITKSLQRGLTSFEEILPLCDGAQPKDVLRIYNKLKDLQPNIIPISLDYKTKFFSNYLLQILDFLSGGIPWSHKSQ